MYKVISVASSEGFLVFVTNKNKFGSFLYTTVAKTARYINVLSIC